MGRPAIKTSPLSGIRRPDAMRSRTDFPDPDAPVMQIIRLLLRQKLTSLIPRFSSKLIETLRNSTAHSGEILVIFLVSVCSSWSVVRSPLTTDYWLPTTDHILRYRLRNQKSCSSSQAAHKRCFQRAT